jgi:ABC-type arginine transport system ATPase subunit
MQYDEKKGEYCIYYNGSGAGNVSSLRVLKIIESSNLPLVP